MLYIKEGGKTAEILYPFLLSSSISFLATFRISNSDQVINEILSDFSELYCDFHCHDLEQANNVIFGMPKSRYSTKKQLAANF